MSIFSELKPFGIETGASSHRLPIVVDGTALDTGHRRRGIGRYVAGLLGELDGLADPRLACLRLHPRRHRGPGREHCPGGEDGSLSMPTWYLKRPPTGHLVRWAINEAVLQGELTRTGCAIYHATEPWALPVGHSFKTVVTCHDVIPLLFPEHYLNRDHFFWRTYYAWLRRKERWKKCDRIIAISEATKQTVIEHLHVPEEKIHVIYNGIDHDQFHPVVDQALLDAVRDRYELRRPFMLYLGGYDFRKNIGVAVRAMQEVPRSIDVELVLAGGMDKAERDEIEAIAASLGITDRVRILGYIDDRDVAGLYALARAFVYPSLAEGFGLQALEAMALGCPVIASDVSSLPEVVEDAGLLVDPRDPAAVGDAMTRLLENDELRQELVQRGFLQARKFSWQRCARETFEVYQDALNER
ncbi:MAG: glycosyltransferase family 4 protein [Bradymonadaceae bacterium]